MHAEDKIFVAGHRGLVGSAIVSRLQHLGFTNLLLRSRSELDLRDQGAVEEFMFVERPSYVFLAAAKVGGILANQNYPADFVYENLLIETAVISAAIRAKCKRLLFLGSSCIYPKLCPQPIKEEYLLSGSLEPTNRPYAIAKIAGIELCWAFNRQFGSRFLAAMPSNLYGPGDNYDPLQSHVIPALLRRFHDAKIGDDSSVKIWGSGTPRREFLFSEDAADACVFLMMLPDERFDILTSADQSPIVNVGSGEEITVLELARLVAEITGFHGELVLDETKPDGTPRKLLDNSRLRSMGWRPQTELRAGLQRAYEDFKAHLIKPLL